MAISTWNLEIGLFKTSVLLKFYTWNNQSRSSQQPAKDMARAAQEKLTSRLIR